MRLPPLFFLVLHLANAFIVPSPPRRRTLSTAVQVVKNPKQAESVEETLGLESGIKPDAFLKNIKEYGNARMARRAVGVLQKMPAFRVTPTADHYNEVLWACEKSDQYALAISVLEEMKLRNIPRSIYSYEALLSVAEKTNHCAETIALKEAMNTEEDLTGSTNTFNSCIWALEKMGESQQAFAMFERMDELNITRDMDTYTACIWAAEKEANAELALQLMSIMKEQNMPFSTATYNGAMWACTKGGYWQDTLNLFDKMEKQKVTTDKMSYNAAIWACDQGDKHNKAIELLKLMKLDGHDRDTMSFDGVISAVAKTHDWMLVMDLLRWMEQDTVKRSPVTYRIAIDTLDAAKQSSVVDELYLQALRDGYYSPWVKRTRALDIRSFSLSVAKVALKMVLVAMKEGKLNKFALNIIVADAYKDESGQVQEIYGSFAVDDLIQNLYNLDLHTHIRSRVEYDENDLIRKYQMRDPNLLADVDMSALAGDKDDSFVHLDVRRCLQDTDEDEGEEAEEGHALEVITLSKETIDAWVACQNESLD